MTSHPGEDPHPVMPKALGEAMTSLLVIASGPGTSETADKLEEVIDALDDETVMDVLYGLLGIIGSQIRRAEKLSSVSREVSIQGLVDRAAGRWETLDQDGNPK